LALLGLMNRLTRVSQAIGGVACREKTSQLIAPPGLSAQGHQAGREPALVVQRSRRMNDGIQPEVSNRFHDFNESLKRRRLGDEGIAP
jgi:hypothetical protein